MATALTSPLPSIHPAYDPLIISLADAAAPASGRSGQSQVEVLLEIEDVLNSDSWRQIGEYLNPYDYATDTATVVLNKAILGTLSPEPSPILSAVLTELPGIMKRYRVKARDVVDGIPEGEFAIVGTSVAWLAGNRYTKLGTDIASDYGCRFLTIRPYDRRIHPSEPLSIQFASFQTVAEVNLILDLLFTDGTTEVQTIALGAVTAFKAYAIKLPAPGTGYTKPVAQIHANFTGFLGSGEFRRWNTITNPTPWFRMLYMQNSMGGFESICLTGKCEESNTPTGEIFEAISFPPSVGGNFKAFNQRATDSLILRTGYLEEEEYKTLKDLTLRNNAYILEGTALRKLILQNATQPQDADGQYLNALEISARYAFENEAYGR